MEANLAKRRKYLGRKKRRRFRRFWSKVILEHHGSLFKRARHLTNGDTSRALDLVQTTALRILNGCPLPTKIKDTKAYLLRSLYFCWTETRPVAEHISLDEALRQVIQFPGLSVQTQVQKDIERKQIVVQVFREMRREYPELRRLLRMKLRRYTCPEIDRFLGKDPGFAKFLWARFTNECRKRMRRSDSRGEQPAA